MTSAHRTATLVIILQLAFISPRAPALPGLQADLSQSVSERLKSEAQAQVDHFLAGGKFPGVTAGITLPDGRSFAVAAGVSNRTTGAAIKTTDRLMQGSVGKTYVSAVALQLVAEGNSTKKAAKLLSISLKTAESHRYRIMKKLNIHDVVGLVRHAVQSGLVRI